MDTDTKTTLMQLILTLENYLMTDAAQKGISKLSAMTEQQQKDYYLKLQSYFNSCL